NPAAATELSGKSRSLRSGCIGLGWSRLNRLLDRLRSECDTGREIGRKPKEGAAIAAMPERGADPFKEIKGRFVFLRMDEMYVDPFAATVMSNFAQSRE